MKTCPNCGSENADNMNFCCNCGTALPSVSPEQKPVQQQPIQQVVATPVQQPAYQQPVQQYQQPAYQQPAPQYQAQSFPTSGAYAEPPKTNGLCKAGFILALVSLVTAGLTSFIGLILSICGLVSASKKKQKGKGLAIAGIIISAIFILVAILFFGVFVEAFNETLEEYEDKVSSYEDDEDDEDDEDKPATEMSSSDIEDKIRSTNWLEKHDNSYLDLESDGYDFTYYQDKEDKDNYYYEGFYDLYVGEDAVEYITEDLEEYGVTEDELEGLFDRNEEYDEANLVCLVIHNETCMIDGENTLEEDVVSPYYGFYLKDGSDEVLDLTNMNTATIFTFIPED